MNRRQFLGRLAVGALAASSPRALATPIGQHRATPEGQLKNWLWARRDFSDMEPWKAQFASWRAAGIDAILPNSGDPEVLSRIVPVATDEGLEVHAWINTLMRGGLEATHPEWYAVNRVGESTAEAPPYVEYYRFLCPSREPVQQHLAEHVRQLTQVDGLVSIHLDYVRYPDVILPIALWDQYDIVQDREYPQYDYCYCEVCRRQFRELSGEDPLHLEDPPASLAWVQFRHDSITHLVNQLASVGHDGDKELSAAVFPTPTIARRLVRQDWPRWHLDAALPMLYHSFYRQPVAWIEESTREGVEAVGDRFPLYAGLYVPELSPDELAEAARRALAGGAAGVALFESKTPTEQHWRKLAPVIGSHRESA